jgi:hypothetical protein
VIPICIKTEKKLFRQYSGFSFFIFIFYWKGVREKSILINHELIHFYQQVEMVFIFHWLLYLLFYLIGRVKGKNHDAAYHSIPFEKEAYAFEHDLQYIRQRKLFAWTKFI